MGKMIWVVVLVVVVALLWFLFKGDSEVAAPSEGDTTGQSAEGAAAVEAVVEVGAPATN